MWSESVRIFDPYKALTEGKASSKSNPRHGDFWIARLRRLGHKAHVTIIQVLALGEDGNIAFIPFGKENMYHAKDCVLFELIEKIDLEKYE